MKANKKVKVYLILALEITKIKMMIMEEMIAMEKKTTKETTMIKIMEIMETDLKALAIKVAVTEKLNRIHDHIAASQTPNPVPVVAKIIVMTMKDAMNLEALVIQVLHNRTIQKQLGIMVNRCQRARKI